MTDHQSPPDEQAPAGRDANNDIEAGHSGPSAGRGPDGRFAPGNPGGPGRSTGHRARLARLFDSLADDDAKAIFEHVKAAALAGDMQAAKEIMVRVWPVPKSRTVEIDLPVIEGVSDLPKAQAALIAAVAAGGVTPAEAQEVAAVFEAYRRSVETVEIEKRLTALEARKK